MSYPVRVVVLMDVLPTKTLGFRWLILCDCNGLNERFCPHKDKMFFIQLQILKETPQMFLD